MAVAMLISGGGSVLISKDLGARDMEHAKMVSTVFYGIYEEKSNCS